MKTYTFRAYSIWKNSTERYDINNQCEATPEFKFEDEPTNEQIVKALIRVGFLKNGVRASDMEFDGNETVIYLADAKDGYPLGVLTLND